jgi:integrase/recombinase XerD
MVDPSRVQVAGPLQPFAGGFAAELARQGYTPQSARMQMQLMAHVSRWMGAVGVAAGSLDEAAVEAFVAVRRDAGYASYRSVRGLAPLLRYLRGLGAVPAAPLVGSEGPVEVLLARYRRYLEIERGLVAAAARGYVDAVRPFLDRVAGPDGLDLAGLDAAEVIAFVVWRCPRQGRSAAKLTVVALRSLLGFLHVEGEIERSLTAAVPSVAG